MIGIRSQPTPEGSIVPTDNKIYDQMLGTRFCYVRKLGYEISGLLSSHSSKTDIHATCDARLVELQRQTTEDRQRTNEDHQMMRQMMEWMV